jgi:hypothetical protein
VNNIVNNACVFTSNTSSNTTLTVTATSSGILKIGDCVIGGGFPVTSQIIQQTSGTLGGVGTYILDIATTAAATGTTMTTNGSVYGAG